MISKSSLAVELSKIRNFKNPKASLEQYPTDSEIAADLLSKAFMLGDVKDRDIIDAGCGSGILGIGCLLLGAKSAMFVDVDTHVLQIAKENVSKYRFARRSFEFIDRNISDVHLKADVVVQNPPFGSKQRHADKIFLGKALENADVVYSFHLTETREFVEKFASDNSFIVTHRWDYGFPLKKSMDFHTKRRKIIDVSCFRIQKI